MGLPPRGYQPHGNHSPPRGFASSDPERQRELDPATEAGDARTRRSAAHDARQDPDHLPAPKIAPVRQSAAGRAGNQPGGDEEGGSRR